MKDVDKELVPLVWEIVKELGAEERHFNDLQSKYRNMSSIWLLATFSAIGFVISTNISLDISTELMVALISILGYIGINLLWIVDLLVYHRLLDSCFVEGIILEEKYPWLPTIRNNMVRSQEGQGVLFRVIAFYLVPIILLINIAGVSVSIWVNENYQFSYAVIAFAIFFLYSILVTQIIRAKTGNTEMFQGRLKEAEKQINNH